MNVPVFLEVDAISGGGARRTGHGPLPCPTAIDALQWKPVTFHDGRGPENEVLGSITWVERRLFGRLVRIQLHTFGSRYEKQLPKYGPIGSARLFVASLWLGLGWITAAIQILVVALTKSYRLLYTCTFVAAVCIGAAVWRLLRAIQDGKRYRSTASKE